MTIGLLLGSNASAYGAPSTLRKGPYLQDLGPDAVSVRLELDPPGRAELEVEVATPQAEAKRVRAEGPDRVAAFQTFSVRGLQPRTTYRYRVVLLDGGPGAAAPGGTGTFTTAPVAGDAVPVNFLVYGDNRTDPAAHAQVVRALTAAATGSSLPSLPGTTASGGAADASGSGSANGTGGVDFLINTGDFVEDGSNEIEWQQFFEIERPLLRDHCVFGAIGNHELVESSGASFLRYFGATLAVDSPAPERDRRRFVRSLRWGELRIFFLNAMDTFSSTEERKWLEAELARTDAETGVTFRFVVLHHGPYSSGPHGNNPRLWNSGVVDMLREHRIDLVWSGHDHLYERGEAKGLKYIVTGGGGAPLYPVRKRLSTSRVVESVFHFVDVKIVGQRFDLVARRVDGSIVDRCGFSKGGTWECDKAPAPAASGTPSTPSTPSTPASSGSRCGCDVPAAPVGGEAAVALASFAVAVLRRRTRSSARA